MTPNPITDRKDQKSGKRVNARATSAEHMASPLLYALERFLEYRTA